MVRHRVGSIPHKGDYESGGLRKRGRFVSASRYYDTLPGRRVIYAWMYAGSCVDVIKEAYLMCGVSLEYWIVMEIVRRYIVLVSDSDTL